MFLTDIKSYGNVFSGDSACMKEPNFTSLFHSKLLSVNPLPVFISARHAFRVLSGRIFISTLQAFWVCARSVSISASNSFWVYLRPMAIPPWNAFRIFSRPVIVASALPSLGNLISHVIGLCTKKKMIGINAGRIVAAMENAKPDRYRSFIESVRNAMGRVLSAVYNDSAISSDFMAIPNPATIIPVFGKFLLPIYCLASGKSDLAKKIQAGICFFSGIHVHIMFIVSVISGRQSCYHAPTLSLA